MFRYLLLWLCSFPLSADNLIDQQLPDFYQQLIPQKYPLSWQSGNYSDIAKWRSDGRALLRSALLWPDDTAVNTAISATLIKTEQRSGYQAQLWQVQLTAYSKLPVMVLKPEQTKPVAAVLLLHDHGARFDIGKEKLIKPFTGDTKLASAEKWTEKYFSGRFIGDELAKQGYLVVGADTFGWGDRGPINYEAQQALASNMFLLGRSLAGMAAYEDLQLVAFIRQLQGVDPARIGVLGFSMGAYRAWQLAALTDDVSATVAVAWMNSYRYLIQPGNNMLRGQSSFYMLHPGLASQMDIPDVAALAAPKPMLLLNGGNDRLMPEAGVRYAYQQMQQVWQAFGAEPQFTGRIFDNASHEFNAQQQDTVYQWLAEQLAPAQ